MTGRVPSFAFSQRAIQFSAIHNASILKHQEQISSGQRFQLSSDEPIAFRQAASMQTRLTELNADRDSINRSTSILNASVTQVQDVINIVNRAKTLTQQGIQSFDDDERNSLAIEVDGLLNQMKQISVAKFSGKFLYGGTQSEEPPFVFNSPNGATGELVVDYNGGRQRSRANVSGSISVSTYYNGLDLFGSSGRGETFLSGTTGAKAGPGTDTMTGLAELSVRHTSTSFLGGSGIQPGISSVDRDNIIGQAGDYQLEIIDTAGDGSAGTIRLNGGSSVTFAAGDTDLVVQGSGGRLVHVDTTNITPGFNGTIDVVATGVLSVDGGLTELPIDHSGSQVVVDSNTNRAVTIDSTQIRQVGTEQLEFLGTSDVFQVLHSLRNDLRNTRGLDARGIAQSLDRRFEELDGVSKKAIAVLGEQSTSLQTLDSLGTRVDDLRISVETELSEVQSTDLPEAVLRLENSQALLQYTYAVTAQLNSLSLLEFLR